MVNLLILSNLSGFLTCPTFSTETSTNECQFPDFCLSYIFCLLYHISRRASSFFEAKAKVESGVVHESHCARLNFVVANRCSVNLQISGMFGRLSITNWTAIKFIRNAYSKHPQVSNACTGFVTFSVGDIIAQNLDGKTIQQIEMKRSLQLGALGMFMNGLCLHRWYVILDKLVGVVKVKASSAAILKVFADQIVYAPFAILTFFGYASICKQTTTPGSTSAWQTFSAKVENHFLTTFVADCSLWPMANFVNFRFIPLVYRASVTAFTQLVWQTYLSVVAHMSLTKDSAVTVDAVVEQAVKVADDVTHCGSDVSPAAERLPVSAAAVLAVHKTRI